MPPYAMELREAFLKKLLPPHNLLVSEVTRQEGISEPTLYNWRTIARQQGRPVPGSKQSSRHQLSTETRFSVVMETAAFSETELAEYCRSKGLYIEQVQEWRDAMMAGLDTGQSSRKTEREEIRRIRKRIKQLEREINRKDKAMAETAALLVLRKKLDALWGDNEDA